MKKFHRDLLISQKQALVVMMRKVKHLNKQRSLNHHTNKYETTYNKEARAEIRKDNGKMYRPEQLLDAVMSLSVGKAGKIFRGLRRAEDFCSKGVRVKGRRQFGLWPDYNVKIFVCKAVFKPSKKVNENV